MPALTRRTVIGGMVATAVTLGTRQAPGAIPQPVLNFLVIGDWGRNGSSHQRDVAVQMGLAAARDKSQCVLTVGDNFYDDGVQSIADPLWHSSFEDVYSAPSLQIPWYVALGNHDYRGRPQAEIDYTAVSSRWRMPARYFEVVGRDLGMPHVDLFVIDTSPLVHKYRQDVDSKIANNVATQNTAAQLEWLDRAMGRSTAPWKLVFGHHTLYSGGSGHGDTPELIPLIEPLLLKHGAQAYFNGHDHDMQHIRRGKLNFICCGAGSAVRPVSAVEGTLFCLSRSGFARIGVGLDTLKLEFRDFRGTSVYSAQIKRDQSVAVSS